jgi:hypothetical protein
MCVHVYKNFVLLDINGRLYVAAFTYPHLTHEVLNLSSMDLHNTCSWETWDLYWTMVYCNVLIKQN